MKKPLFLFLSIALSLPAMSLSARAADDPIAAREHYHRGSKLFDLQRYREAAKEFEAAYEAKADPAFLYNIGQAYRLAGDSETAIGAYRSYLRRMTKAPNRAEIEGRITEMQTILDAQKRSRDSEPAGVLRPGQVPANTPSNDKRVASREKPVTPSPGNDESETASSESEKAAAASESPRSPKSEESRPGLGKKIGGAVIMGAGVVAVGLGAVFAVQANSASDQLTHPTPGQAFDPALEDSFRTNRGVAIGMIAGGGVAVVGGAVLFLLGYREGRAAPVSLLPTFGPGRAGASLSLRF